jgi:glycosyltransferase involved in cell wall biosynthesis
VTVTLKKPLLSVCVITYNHARYIREAIDSILMQKIDYAWQLIVADDRSTDGTTEILLEYQKKFPDRIKLILQKRNVGAETNWLDLMAYPSSKYVLYMEGDDYLSDPSKLQRQVSFLEAHPDFALCFHPAKVMYDDGSRPDEMLPSPELRFNKRVLGQKDLLTNNFMATSSVMYRWRFTQENIKKAFPKNIITGDWLLHLLHAEVGKIGFLNRTMSVYRRHPGGFWWDVDNDASKFYKKHGIAHLALYDELLKRYGKSEEYRQIIYRLTQNMLNNVVDVDDKDNSLLHQAQTKFPALVEEFIVYQQQTLQHERLLQEEKDHEIQSLIKLNQRKIQEMKTIKSSKLWKLRNRLAKIVGKDFI